MKRLSKYYFTTLLVAWVLSACAQQLTFSESVKIKLTNPTGLERSDVMVFISADKLPSSFNKRAFAAYDKKVEIPSQYNQQDKDFSGIVVVIDKLKGKEVKELVVRYNKSGEVKRTYTKRTQAELSHKTGGEWKAREYIGGDFKNVDYLRVPAEHKDHSWFIRYEGPGWESDKVGYRFYLDQRNAVDVFGKTVKKPALQKAGLDGFDSYHQMQAWGMDVLKVAKSLGVGSIGYFNGKSAVRVELTDSVTCRITENGDVYSSILTNYYGWNTGQVKTDLASRLSIHAGTRLTRNSLSLSADVDNLCTGLIKDPKGKLISRKADQTSFGYIATYGKQSLNNDNLGIAVLFSANDFMEFTGDEFSHIVKLKPTEKKLTYYFVAAWEGEPDGIKSEEAFINYLEQEARALAQPIQIEVKK